MLPRFAVVSDTLATLREVVLFPRDLRTVVPESRPGDDIVVFVHGFFASAGVFRPMRRHLHDAGLVSASFSYVPGVSISRIAKKLAALVDALPKDRRVHLVGHSLGGLVSRWYVQELGGHERVAQTISLASPFAGTERANLVPLLVGADLATYSAVLDRLRARARTFDVPHTSIVGDSDWVVVPNHSAMFPHGDVVVLPGRGHNALLYDDAVYGCVLDRVKTTRA